MNAASIYSYHWTPPHLCPWLATTAMHLYTSSFNFSSCPWSCSCPSTYCWPQPLPPCMWLSCPLLPHTSIAGTYLTANAPQVLATTAACLSLLLLTKRYHQKPQKCIQLPWTPVALAADDHAVVDVADSRLLSQWDTVPPGLRVAPCHYALYPVPQDLGPYSAPPSHAGEGFFLPKLAQKVWETWLLLQMPRYLYEAIMIRKHQGNMTPPTEHNKLPVTNPKEIKIHKLPPKNSK